MEIITFTAIKGGVGKTTLTYNYADWLAKHGKKILLIDLDHQCNLTTLFQKTRVNNTIAEAFKEVDIADEVQIDTVRKNIDLIAGYIDLDEVGSNLENNSNKNMLLYLWFKRNIETINLKKYDYILIDTHPDFGIITRNAISISDYLISPITPSEHGYNAKFDLEARLEKYRKVVINYETGKTYIDAELFFVANMVKHNTTTSHELISHISDDKSVLGIINEKELFNKSSVLHKTIFDLKENDEVYKKNMKFYENTESVFNNIFNTTSK